MVWEVIEWELPVTQGGARAETQRYRILHELTELSTQYNFHWQTLPYGSRWRLRVLIETRDLTILALIWPEYLEWRRIGNSK